MVRDGSVLLSHWVESGHSGWTMPGGGVEFGEDPGDAAVREVFEETGFHVVVDELLGIHSHVIDDVHGDRVHGVRIVYRATITGGVLTDEVDGSTDRADWFPLDALPGDRVGLVDIALAMG